MKKLLTTASTALLLAGLAAQAQAADGTITFNGNVTAQSCTPTVAGGTANGTVTLPTVSAKSLASAGVTAGTTQFSIALSGCSAAATQAATWFEAGSNVDPASGRLINTGTATKVDVALYNSTGTTPIAVGQGNGSLGSSGTAVPITNNAATMNFNARYYATGAATAGSVVASVNYTIQYQ
ncbi:fimbrial protein [Aquitalea magnusonii]|uniref:Major type 1 subunit fimbrin (Pilin) n=1 Tax=Aquitalea magnusonii TaxID=332411 RepID=A0A318JAX8_9NEIS|nr:fimbrial protein [Aquitalea magnusonii]PXX44662.1 major type 1 subunit fimbrin (pilin) [Aquitalea magnusonii]